MTVENIRYFYENVEKTVAKSLNEVPEDLRQKNAQFEKMQSDRLKGEMQGLNFQKRNAFKAPPKEWIQHRLDKFQETLDKTPRHQLRH